MSDIYAFWRRRPIQDGSVLYESFSGNGMLCNPEAIFRELLASPDMKGLTHIWVLSDLHQYRATIDEFRRTANVKFVRYRSSSYYRALATSKYLVNNATFRADFSKRQGQLYVNTWHGTPLKRMGYDVNGGALASANIVRNFVAADFLLAANPFMADQMYERAYKLKGIYPGRIIVEGYPRIDRQILTTDGVAAGRERLVASGIALGEREIILYAPTWRGSSFDDPTNDIDGLLEHVSRIESLIDTSKYVVLLKAHQVVHKYAASRPGLKSVLVPNDIPTNVVLGLTGILITDYSSVFFDFLATGSPVLFFVHDVSDYADTRGLYLDTDELPGPVSSTVEELAADIRAIAATGDVSADTAIRYRAAQLKYCGYEDGSASARVVDIVFRGVTHGRDIRSGLNTGRPSVLIYLGGMRSNGITSSALSLLDNLRNTDCDVSAFFAKGVSADAKANQRAIPAEVRQFVWVGGTNGGTLRKLARRIAFRRGRTSRHRDTVGQNTHWDDEWTRCFGNSHFDYVIDFSGYGPFWAVLLLHSPDAIRSIWLHNDLASDAHREVDGEKKMLHSLSEVFTLYEQFDHLVSVSPMLADINRRGLAEYASASKFAYALNSVDGERVIENAALDLRDLVGQTTNASQPTPAWLDDLLADDGVTTFVTVGRLSPEKNQARLIRAFAAVHEKQPNTRLVLVGDGPLRRSLAALIEELGLGRAVVLTGLQRNPHAILAASDCFVLSSDYEGQPMVLLEALVLGMPIVTVDFASVESALPPGSGLVVPQTDDGLADGLLAFLRGEVAPTQFDHKAYNARVVGQFFRAIGAPARLRPQHR